MREEKFTELVNLYLDKEISDRGLAELKAELAHNAERKAEFAERCRLHQAMRLALNPAAAKRLASSASKGNRWREGSRERSRRAGSTGRSTRSTRSGSRPASGAAARAALSSSRDTRVDERTQRSETVAFPRWILGAGLAASFALGLTLLVPVFRDTTAVAAQPELKGVDADELIEEDPLDRIGRTELRRFASVQAQRAANERASLAAQLRLMGLRPELTPREKQLRTVSLAAIQPRGAEQDHAELLAEMQKMTPIPAPQILRSEPVSVDVHDRWPSGFHSSLASFK